MKVKKLKSKRIKHIFKISPKIKNKYNNINWDIIKNERYDDDIFIGSIKIVDAWKLCSTTLSSEMLDKLNILLELELPNYYKTLCNREHEKFIKNNKN